MKYQTGKTYMHPNTPMDVMAEIVKHDMFAKGDFERLEFLTPDHKQLNRPIASSSVFDPDSPATTIRKPPRFKRKELTLVVWECELGDE